jgi:hypothetical protein
MPSNEHDSSCAEEQIVTLKFARGEKHREVFWSKNGMTFLGDAASLLYEEDAKAYRNAQCTSMRKRLTQHKQRRPNSKLELVSIETRSAH